MSRAYSTGTLALTAALLVMMVASAPTTAAEKEYKPKVKVTPLVETRLQGVEGKKVIIKQFTLPAGYVGGRHSHPGQVFVYVLDGELTVDVDGEPRQSFAAGDVFEEPVGRAMQGRNLDASSPAAIVVFQVGDADKPMMIKAE